MSNPTFYTVNGVDLSNIFQPYSGPPSAITTGYKVNTTDLNLIFAPYVSGNPQASPTGYTVPIYGDLNQIFAKYNPVTFTATGDYTITSDGTYNTIITFKSGIGTILFNTNVGTVSCIVVGGGGGAGHGMKAASGTSGGSGGRGGGGGQVIQQNLTYSIATSYNISIGAGGTGGYWVSGSTVASTNGNPSSLDIIVALGGTKDSGGNGGNGGTGISSSNNGTNGSAGSNGYGSSGGGGGGGTGGLPSPQSLGGTSTNGAGSGGKGSASGGGSGNTGGGAGDNTGGGGGGGGGAGNTQSNSSSNGGNGGSGIIILKF